MLGTLCRENMYMTGGEGKNGYFFLWRGMVHTDGTAQRWEGWNWKRCELTDIIFLADSHKVWIYGWNYLGGSKLGFFYWLMFSHGCWNMLLRLFLMSFLTDFHANPLSLEREAVIHHKDNEKLSNIILIFICAPRAPRHPNLHVNYHHPITG